MPFPSLPPITPGLIFGKPLLSATTFQVGINREYLVKGLLLSSQVSILVGPPNTGKSSVVACLAASIAMGRAVAEARVKRGAVLYVAAEDPTGLQNAHTVFSRPNPLTLPFLHPRLACQSFGRSRNGGFLYRCTQISA